jgi:predicted metal-dependent hydrolase
VIEKDAAPGVILNPGECVREQAKIRGRRSLPNSIANRSKKAVPPLLVRWARVTGVSVDRFYVQEMKTKWGGCNPGTRAIRLNTELAKKPTPCLEYIVVHEMVHLWSLTIMVVLKST